VRNDKSFHIITLGCPKNTVDAENMTAVLENAGYQEEGDPSEADVIIVNTCCFILPAKQEAVDTIYEAAGITQETGGKLIVTGCMPQRYKDELADEFVEVDSWMGLENLEEIVPVVKETLDGKKVRKFYGDTPSKQIELPRKVSTPSHYAYLKIAEGCSHACSFCVIPQIRGKYRSLPMEDAVESAKKLVTAGHKELILIAQDTTLYGLDIYGKKMLPDLLKNLAAIEGLNWLRLMYAYPTSLDDEVLKTIASEEKICKYLDIPLQHSHPEVLKKMGRPFAEKDTVGLIERIRNIIPDVTLRTAFITGHPGETQARFEHLMDFVEKMRFQNVGVFTYSPEEGSASAEFKTRPSGVEAERRREQLMQLQQGISAELRSQKVGKVIPAVCDSIIGNGKRMTDLLEEAAAKALESGENTNFEEEGFLIDISGEETIISSHIPAGTTAIGRTISDAP